MINAFLSEGVSSVASIADVLFPENAEMSSIGISHANPSNISISIGFKLYIGASLV